MTKKNSLPDRWLAYKNIGVPISGTRFIAFKSPLDEKFSTRLPFKDRFTPNQLCDTRPDLGLVIDLTNTCRYYQPQLFGLKNIKHYKLACVGREIPTERIVRRFCNVVHDFLHSNDSKDSLIGVHCTHGVNRTGYLICSYLVRQMLMDPREAISAFEAARGHPIEREHYVNALLKLQVKVPIFNGQRMLDDDFMGDADASSSAGPTTSTAESTKRRGKYTPLNRHFVPGRRSMPESTADSLATAGRSTSDPWAAAPGPEADPWPPASGSASSSWSPAPGPVAGPSRKSSFDQFTPAYSEGTGLKARLRGSTRAQSKMIRRMGSDTSEQPWRSFNADQDTSHQDLPNASASSRPKFSRGQPARGHNHRWEDGRPTPSHLAPPEHLPSLPPPQSSSSLPSFTRDVGAWAIGSPRASTTPVPMHTTVTTKISAWDRGRGRGGDRGWRNSRGNDRGKSRGKDWTQGRGTGGDRDWSNSHGDDTGKSRGKGWTWGPGRGGDRGGSNSRGRGWKHRSKSKMRGRGGAYAVETFGIAN